jgi:hypothetical protein
MGGSAREHIPHLLKRAHKKRHLRQLHQAVDRRHHHHGRPEGNTLERQFAEGHVELVVLPLSLPHLLHPPHKLLKVGVDAVAALALALLLLDLVRVVLFVWVRGVGVWVGGESLEKGRGG